MGKGLAGFDSIDGASDETGPSETLGIVGAVGVGAVLAMTLAAVPHELGGRATGAPVATDACDERSSVCAGATPLTGSAGTKRRGGPAVAGAPGAALPRLSEVGVAASAPSEPGVLPGNAGEPPAAGVANGGLAARAAPASWPKRRAAHTVGERAAGSKAALGTSGAAC